MLIVCARVHSAQPKPLLPPSLVSATDGGDRLPTDGEGPRRSASSPDQIGQPPALLPSPVSLHTPSGRRRRGASEREGGKPKTLAPPSPPAASGEMAVDEVTSVYVGGLPYEANEDMLRNAFEYYGTIVSVKVPPRSSPLSSPSG